MVAAEAIVTSRGGVTSHAAVVARGMGKCCVVGCEEIEVDYADKLFRVGDRIVSHGEWVTVDGNNGHVLAGQVDTVEAELDDYYERSWRGQTSSERSRSGPTPTRRRMPRQHGASERKGSVCAAPSTCSSKETESRPCRR